MKKTLKFLLAITLFVAILAIAGLVNADEAQVGLSYLQTNPTNSPYLDASNKLTTPVPSTEPKIKLEGNVTIDLNGKDIEPEITVNGNLTLKNSGAAVAVTGKIINNGTVTIDENVANKITLNKVENNGTLNLKTNGDAVEVTLRENGTLNITGTSVVDQLISDKSYTYENGTINKFTANKKDVVFTMSKDLAAAKKIAAANLKNNEGTFVVLTAKNNTVYFVNKDAVEYTFDIKKVPTGESVRDLKAGETYAIDAQARYDGRDLVGTLTFTPEDTALAVTAGTVKLNDGIEYPAIRMNKDLGEKEMVLRATYTENTVATPIKEKVVNGKEAPATTAPATDAPATTAPATDAPNKGDKDETPKTGDQIIPATALLAVVVVANVVYFAKSKRS